MADDDRAFDSESAKARSSRCACSDGPQWRHAGPLAMAEARAIENDEPVIGRMAMMPLATKSSIMLPLPCSMTTGVPLPLSRYRSRVSSTVMK